MAVQSRSKMKHYEYIILSLLCKVNPWLLKSTQLWHKVRHTGFLYRSSNSIMHAVRKLVACTLSTTFFLVLVPAGLQEVGGSPLSGMRARHFQCNAVR